MVPAIIDAVEGDLKNTVFSFIPNTAETAYYGMVEGVEELMKQKRRDEILALG